MAKYVYLHRITRADDNIIAQIAGRDYFTTVCDPELPICGTEYDLAKQDVDNNWDDAWATQKFWRIVYMENKHVDIKRICREYGIPDDKPVQRFHFEDQDNYTTFACVNQHGKMIPSTIIHIPLDEMPGYYVKPFIPVVVWGTASNCLYDQSVYDKLDAVFKRSGAKFHPDGQFRHLLLTDEMYKIIRRVYPHQCYDYLDQKYHSDYVWEVELVCTG